jgi:hypothetical protein
VGEFLDLDVLVHHHLHVVGLRWPMMIAVATFLRSVAIGCFSSCEKHANPDSFLARCGGNSTRGKKSVDGAVA